MTIVFGSQRLVTQMKYPDDCLQTTIEPSNWWVADSATTVSRGALVFAFAPHVDQVPYTIQPIGRSVATEHDKAELEIKPLTINQPRSRTALPVAAMTLNEGEIWSAYRAKKRPCLVLSKLSPLVKKSLTRGKPNWMTAPTVLCAPYYGATLGKRAGFSVEFITRIRHCEYPQFFWDILPHERGEESILRLDQLQPLGIHHNSYELSGYRLSDDALDVMDDFVRWVIWGGVRTDGMVAGFRALIEHTFPGAGH